MAFLRTLFWIILTIVVVVFTLHNWQPVTIDLFGGLQADVKLPVLLLIAFALGFVPLYLYHRLRLWQQRRAMSGGPAVAAADMPAASPGEPGPLPVRGPLAAAAPAHGSAIPPADAEPF